MVDVTVIGVGSMGAVHARAVNENPILNLRSVVDVDRRTANRVAAEFTDVSVTTDYEDALGNVDAAIIASPETVHYEHAIAAFSNDVHFILEKPISNNLGEAMDLARHERSSDVVTGVNFPLRYNAEFSKLRAEVLNGSLGELVSVHARRAIAENQSRKRSGTREHPLLYSSIHDLDAIMWCLNTKITSVYGTQKYGVLEDIGLPDTVHALLRFEDDGLGVLEGYGVFSEESLYSNLSLSEFQVVGDSGTADLRKPSDNLVITTDSTARASTSEVQGEIVGETRRLVHSFANTIRGERDRMPGMLEDGVRAQIVAEAIRNSFDRDREVVVDYEFR
jgi:predicted dehydrogenase